MSQTLTLLTSTQMSNYIAGLDLAEGTQAYAVLNSLLLLPTAAYAQAISALAGGLITLAQVAALPAVNAGLVEGLINAALGSTSAATLEYNYARVWLPASIDLAALQASAVGSVTVYLAARAYDFWGSLIVPDYDFTGATPTSYSSYASALDAYLSAVNSAEANAAVAAFQAADAALYEQHPQLLQESPADRPVLQAVLSLQTSPYFLENPTTGRVPNEILDLVASAAYRAVSPADYRNFMQTVAYPAMAAAQPGDPALSGAPGAAAVAAAPANAFGPLPATGVEWALDLPSMAQVYLPQAYGTEVLSSGQIAAGAALRAALVAYLDAARAALLGVQAAAAANFPADASLNTLPGTPIGLLLALTYT
jgi:hypothetical protein